MSESIVPAERIEHCIYVIRGYRVMPDRDLAILYGVETKALNRAILRNADRFPEDFAFRLTETEWEILRCQIGTSRLWGGRRYLPWVFTEHGVTMAANVLRSKRASLVSIAVVRAFIKLRQILTTQRQVEAEIAELKSFVLKHSQATDREFRKVWRAIERLQNPPKSDQPRIGFRLD